MAGIQIVTAPVIEPISINEVQSYLRIPEDEDLDIIRSLIIVARQMCEEYTGRAILTQTVDMFLDGANETDEPLREGMTTGPYLNFYKNYLVLPKSPIQSITSVSTFADDDTETTFASSKYFADIVREPARIVLRTGETWPTALRVANAIKVRYTAGYATIEDIPKPMLLAMQQYIAFLYDQRGDMKDYQQASTMPPIIKRLLAPYVIHDALGSSKLMALG